jgi:hypothetical protein
MAVTDFTVDRNTVKYVLNSSGDIASVAIDTPAIEYNTDGTYKGLLVEPASTNICLQSEDINTTWTDQNATPTQSTEETPDGDTSSKYIKLVDDSVGGTAQIRIIQDITISVITKYTFSVFLKADQLAFGRLQVYDGTSFFTQFYGLSGAGSLGTASAGVDDSTIEKYPNDWYRCTITITPTAGSTTLTVYINVADSISNVIVDRDGTSSIYVWGMQVEASPIATSYIPTTTASVTRNKDDISLTGASDLIGQSEGTLYIEVDWRGTSGADQLLLSVNDGTSNNRFIIYKLNSATELRMFGVANGSFVTNQGESSTSYSDIQKIALAYKTNDFELYRNGSSISTDTVGSLASLATLTTVDLGQAFNTTVQANMWIRAVALYKTRLTHDQLADLTS